MRSSENFTDVAEYEKMLDDHCLSIVGRYNESAERTGVDEGFDSDICARSPSGGPAGDNDQGGLGHE